jgi:hypothetical protein
MKHEREAPLRDQRWLSPQDYARVAVRGTVTATGRNSQEAFERAVARELSGDCC